MGAFLEKPITKKTTASGEGQGLRYAVSAMQGWRKEMEDTHIAATDFKIKNHAFFGVFDGHAGSKASEYCSQHILDCIVKGLGGDVQEPSHEALKKAIGEGFLSLDEEMKNTKEWETGQNRGGTTAITVMITPDKIIFGNCGDSRGLFCRNGEVLFETKDHKPVNEIERRRIEKAGGSVMMQRVNGSLAVSRALGDFEFKLNHDRSPVEQLVSPEPDMTVFERDHAMDHYVFLACDGVYDVMTNEEIVKFINKKLKIEDDLTKICSDLIDLCLHKNSRDNMSAILITFKAAPQVDPKVAKEEEELRLKVVAEVTDKLQDLVNEASDPLELEENEVMSRLTESLHTDFDLAELRPTISDKLAEKKKEKFGDSNFDGPGDSADMPVDSYFNYGGHTVVLQAETDGVPASQPKSSESTLEGERPSDNLSSTAQTDSIQSA